MTVLRMLDRGSAPSAAAARRALDDANASAWGFYLGGAGHQNFTEYSPGLLTDLQGDGVAFLPIYVGRQSALSHERGRVDALDALTLSSTFGDPNRLIICDVERFASDRDMPAAVEYVRGWTEAMHARGFLSGVYGAFNLMNAAAQADDPKPDMIWPAVWMEDGGVLVSQSRWPTAHTALKHIDASLWSNPGQRAWQFAGEQTLPDPGGINVDVSIVDQACFGITDPSVQPLRARTPATPTTPTTGTIVVQPNDILSALEANHGLAPGSLFAANQAALDETARRHGKPDSGHGHFIFPGQVLHLPGGAPAQPQPQPQPPPQPQPQSIVVQPNDILSALEVKHGLAPGSLFAANQAALDETARRHGKPDSGHGHFIFPGQVLQLP